MDPYLLLEVPHTASIEDIKKAYRRLAKKWHPDTHGGSTQAADMFKKIKAAYDCLVDPIKRAAEDLKRKHREQAEAAKMAKAEAEQQARARAYAQPPPSSLGINPLTVGLALLAVLFVIVALFRIGASSSTSKA